MDKVKKISNILDTSRKRIIDFIDKQGIRPKEFLEKTGLAKGFIDRSHQNSGASDVNLSKILDAYPSLNAHWLLTGKGPMILENSPSHPLASDSEERYTPESIIDQKETIEALRLTIKAQEETIRALKDQVRLLTERQTSNEPKHPVTRPL